MKLITEDFQKFGAQVGKSQGSIQPRKYCSKKGMHLNDVCWNCWPGNYLDILSKLNLLKHPWGGGESGQKHQGYGRLRVVLQQVAN